MYRPLLPRVAPFLLSLALAGLTVTLGGLSFYRKVESFQPIGFDAQPLGTSWDVTRVHGSETPLRTGDQILLVNGVEAARIADLGAELRQQQQSDLLVERGDGLESITYVRPPLDIDYPYLVLALIGAAYLLVGLFTWLKDHRRASLLFYLWCLTAAVVYLFSPLRTFDTLDKAVYLVEELCRVLLPPLTLHLFLRFPESRSPAAKLLRAIPFLYLPAAVLLTLQVDLIFFQGRWLFSDPSGATLVAMDRWELYHLVSYSLIAALLLAFRLAQHRDWEQRRQLQWIAVGMVGGFLPFLALYVVPDSLGLDFPELLEAAAVLPLGLVPLTFAWAILRYKLWDIGVIVRDTLSYTITLLLGICSFSIVNLMISRGIPDEMALVRNLSSFAAGLIIAGLLIPTQRGVTSALQRVQYHSTFRRRRSLWNLADELLHERRLRRLCESLLRGLEEGLLLERANLFLAEGAALEPVERHPGLPDRLELDALGKDFWDKEYQGLSGVALPAGRVSAAQQLFIAGYRYAFPLTVRDRRVGTVVTSYKEEQRPLNSDDLDLLRNLLNQAALAIENALLVDELRRQLREVSRLEEYSKGIVESSPAGIAVLDRDNGVVSVNLAFAALCGLSQEKIHGRRLQEVLPIQPLPRPAEGLLEVSFCDLSGKEWYLQISLAGFHDETGQDLRILVVHDVSERVAMEQALKEKDRLAALGMLAAGLAHEVNTPITGISSYAQILLNDTPESDPRHRLLKKVEQQTFRASRIVNSLLEFARNRHHEPSPVVITEILDECVDMFRDRCHRHGIEIVWEPGSQRIQVLGHEGELQQVFTNLVLNAIDAMSDGGGRLVVEVEPDETWVRTRIHDTGEGISPARLQRIFEPFFSTKSGRGGTGLGLAISYDIVQRHGGTMDVDSTPGKGTQFTVALRRAHRSSESDA